MKRPAPRRTLAALALAVSASLGSCVSGGGDVELAPLWSRASSAGGGTRSEAVFGAFVADRADADGPVDAWAVRPLFAWRREPDGEAGPVPKANARWRADYLYPLGRATGGERTSSNWLVPLWFRRTREMASGAKRTTWLSLPGIWWASDEEGGAPALSPDYGPRR